MKIRILNIALLSIITINLFSQTKEEDFKNIILFAPLSLLDKTISISYSRKLTENAELVINPRIRKGNDLQGIDILVNSFSYDYLNKYMIRLGVDFHNEFVFFEPLLQYGYGYYDNRLFALSEITFKSYNSIGAIALTGILFDISRVRTKLYTGLGYHKYFYTKNGNNKLPVNPNEDPFEGFSLHFGFELGIMF